MNCVNSLCYKRFCCKCTKNKIEMNCSHVFMCYVYIEIHPLFLTDDIQPSYTDLCLECCKTILQSVNEILILCVHIKGKHFVNVKLGIK